MTKVERGYEVTPHQHMEESERHLDAALLQLDLLREVEALRSRGTGSSGHVAKTLAKHHDLRVVLIAFAHGGRLERHSAPGRVCVQAIDGHVAIRVADQTLELKAGGLLEIGASLEHEVEALAESSILLTIAWPKS